MHRRNESRFTLSMPPRSGLVPSIAEMRAVPVGTVKTQMRTALIKLRKVLNPDAADVPADEGQGQ